MSRVVALNAATLALLALLAPVAIAKPTATAVQNATIAPPAPGGVNAPRSSKQELMVVAKRKRTSPQQEYASDAAPEGAKTGESVAAMRFRQFLSPQSMALNAGEELRAPRPRLAELFAGPLLPVAAAVKEGHREPQAPPSDISMPAAASGDALSNSDPLPPQPDHGPPWQNPHRSSDNDKSAKADTTTSNLANKDKTSASWIQLAFLAWGGLLTIGSAIRLLIG